jgi:type IV secretory pathway VirB10-like protein
MESAVHRGVGEDIVRLGTEMAREASQQPPLITIRQGAPFLINVNKDIAFKRPYDDGIRRDPRPERKR